MVKGVLKVMIFCIFYSDIMHALFKVMLFVLHFIFWFKRMCNNTDFIPRIFFSTKLHFAMYFNNVISTLSYWFIYRTIYIDVAVLFAEFISIIVYQSHNAVQALYYFVKHI